MFVPILRLGFSFMQSSSSGVEPFIWDEGLWHCANLYSLCLLSEVGSKFIVQSVIILDKLPSECHLVYTQVYKYDEIRIHRLFMNLQL